MKKIYILTCINAYANEIISITAYRTRKEAREEMKRLYEKEYAQYKEDYEGEEPEAIIDEDEAQLVYGYDVNDMYLWDVHEVALPWVNTDKNQ